jgi:hypothetical protein
MRAEGNYRDDLAAAHARIAELEEKLAARDAGVEEPMESASAPDPAAELEAEFEALEAERRTLTRPSFTRPAFLSAVPATLLLTTDSALARTVILLVTVIFATLLLGIMSGDRRHRAKEIARIDARIAELRRQS